MQLRSIGKRAVIVPAVAVFTLFPWCRPVLAGEKSNVIIVSLDLLRTDWLAAYGGRKDLAPNIDAFHAKSVVYLNAISPSCWTLPAAVSVFTGLYPSQHKITNTTMKEADGSLRPHTLAKNIITLPEVFGNNGYDTAYFTSGGQIWNNFGLERGISLISNNDTQYLSGSLGRAEAWLNGRQGEKPFFMLVQGFDLLHWEQVHESSAPVPPGFAPGPGLKPDVGVYDARLKAADLAFGRFMDFLAGKGFFENTVIVFLSHHGEGLGTDGHGPAMHGAALYEELIRVPLAVYRPGAAPALIETQVSLAGLGPALITAAGLGNDKKYSAQAGGKTLYPFAGNKRKCKDLVSEMETMYMNEQTAIRTCSGWKLIHNYRDSRSQLFNLKDDPGEKKDLFNEKPAEAALLEEELFKWMAD